MKLARAINYHVVQEAVDAVFLRVLCLPSGRVHIGISREQMAGIANLCGKGAVAAQWAWVGNAARGKALERALRKRWTTRYRAGDGFGFDYETEGVIFRSELDATFKAVVGVNAEWRKVSPEEVASLLGAGPKKRVRPRLSFGSR